MIEHIYLLGHDYYDGTILFPETTQALGFFPKIDDAKNWLKETRDYDGQWVNISDDEPEAGQCSEISNTEEYLIIRWDLQE